MERRRGKGLKKRTGIWIEEEETRGIGENDERGGKGIDCKEGLKKRSETGIWAKERNRD